MSGKQTVVEDMRVFIHNYAVKSTSRLYHGVLHYYRIRDFCAFGYMTAAEQYGIFHFAFYKATVGYKRILYACGVRKFMTTGSSNSIERL